MRILPFKPIVTNNYIDIPNCYEYGPSVVNGRVFWTSGLNIDTITSIRLNGTKPSVPYYRTDKLVADPYAYKDQWRYIVYHTIGELTPNKLGNGVGFYIADGNGNPIAKTSKMLINQNGMGTYGTGQPSVTKLGSQLIMFVREDGPGGVNTIGAYKLTSDGRNVTTKIPFINIYGTEILEDGASPEIFVYNNKLHMLISGGGPVGLRTYEYAAGKLRRETELEQSINGFYAQSTISLSNIIDGAGIMRGPQNLPVVVDRHLTIWYGAGNGADAGTWRLEKGYIKLP